VLGSSTQTAKLGGLWRKNDYLLISPAALAGKKHGRKFWVWLVALHGNVAHAGATIGTSRRTGKWDYFTGWHGTINVQRLTLPLFMMLAEPMHKRSNAFRGKARRVVGAMSSELHDEATECHRVAAEYKQKADATNSPTDKELYKLLGDSDTELAQAYEAVGVAQVSSAALRHEGQLASNSDAL